MKISVALCITVIGTLSLLKAQEDWELKLPKISKEEQQLKEKMSEMINSLEEYSSGRRSATKNEIQLIEELYSTELDTKLAQDIKSYAFAAMVLVKDIREWSLELPNLLNGDSRQMAGAAIDAVYYIYKKGSNNDKLFLLDDADLEKSLKNVSEKFKDENYTRKINKIFELSDELKNLRNEGKLEADVNVKQDILLDDNLTSTTKSDTSTTKKLRPFVEEMQFPLILGSIFLLVGIYYFLKPKK